MIKSYFPKRLSEKNFGKSFRKVKFTYQNNLPKHFPLSESAFKSTLKTSKTTCWNDFSKKQQLLMCDMAFRLDMAFDKLVIFNMKVT